MAASPLSVVLKGGWPNLDCLHLCTKAVKWVEWEIHRHRKASARFRYTVWSAGQLTVNGLYTSFIKFNILNSNILFV